MTEYRKSRITYGFEVVAPDGGTRVSQSGFETEVAMRKAARRQARFYDQLERDRVDGVVPKRTSTILERGVRPCIKCGKPHDCVATTRRGKRWGRTWEAPDCDAYRPMSWEDFARQSIAEQVAA